MLRESTSLRCMVHTDVHFVYACKIDDEIYFWKGAARCILYIQPLHLDMYVYDVDQY